MKNIADFTNCFFVLDFDRTLGNTDAFHDILERVIEEETMLKSDFLAHARFTAEKQGKSFNTIEYLRTYLEETDDSRSWFDIQRKFITAAQKEDTLEPDAAELLRLLDKENIPYGILTYGGEAWQLAKLEGANLLQIPHLVTHIQAKGVLLSEWKQASGKFLIPPAMTRTFEPFLVDTIFFLDDKTVSFENMPAGVQGIRIRPPEGIKLPAQRGTLPAGVVEVEGVRGAIELLFKE